MLLISDSRRRIKVKQARGQKQEGEMSPQAITSSVEAKKTQEEEGPKSEAVFMESEFFVEPFLHNHPKCTPASIGTVKLGRGGHTGYSLVATASSIT